MQIMFVPFARPKFSRLAVETENQPAPVKYQILVFAREVIGQLRTNICWRINGLDARRHLLFEASLLMKCGNWTSTLANVRS
jgi:hypothetical protein